MVELIHRLIPRDIEKLQRMDALVHIFDEVSGTDGAFAAGLCLSPERAIAFNPVLLVDEVSTIIGENFKHSDTIGENKVYSEKNFNN
jgi:hypothetical protein